MSDNTELLQAVREAAKDSGLTLSEHDKMIYQLGFVAGARWDCKNTTEQLKRTLERAV